MDKSTGKTGVIIQNNDVWFRIIRTVNGKRKEYRENVGSDTKANVVKADKVRRELVASIDNDYLAFEELWLRRDPEAEIVVSGTLTDISEQWIKFAETFRNKEKGYAGSNLDSIRASLNSLWIPALGKKPLNKITFDDVRDVVKSDHLKEASLKTLQNHVGYLKAIFRFADVELDISCKPFPTNDMKYPKRPTKSEPEFPYNPDELNLIMQHVNDNCDLQTQTYFVLFRGTGMRTGEILATEWNDIRGDYIWVTKAVVRGELKPPKTWEKRKVYIQPQVMKKLNELRKAQEKVVSIESVAKGDFIFKNSVLSHYNDARKFNKAWDEAHTAVKLPSATARRIYNDLRAEGMPEDQIAPYLDKSVPKRRPYMLRHTRASELISMGAAEEGPAQLGHSPLMFFTTYAKQIEAYEDTKKDKSKLDSLVHIG